MPEYHELNKSPRLYVNRIDFFFSLQQNNIPNLYEFIYTGQENLKAPRYIKNILIIHILHT